MMSGIKRVALALLAAPLLAAGPAGAPAGTVRVRIVTAAGPITLALDARHAPWTTANFLRYVDDGRFEGASFYRAAHAKGRAGGFIEGGIGTDPRRVLPAVSLEPTSRTGLHHDAGAVTMARFADPNSATGNFSLLVGPDRSMDAHGKDGGYAVFGHVIAGLDVVKRILAQPTAPGGSGAMKGETLVSPVPIVRAERLDGRPQPTGRPKPWLIDLPRR